jgi:hypothetical protein
VNQVRTQSDIDKDIIRLSFNNSFEKCVRLASFGSAIAPIKDDSGHSSKILIQLAYNDLVTLAISTRRLIDAGNLRSSAIHFEIACQVPHHSTEAGVEFVPTKKKIAIRTLFNKIIHSSRLEIHTTEFRIGCQLGIFGSDTYNLYRAALKAKKFKPVGEVFDEEKKLYFFEVVELAQRTIDFLHQASKDLEDQIDLGQPKD